VLANPAPAGSAALPPFCWLVRPAAAADDHADALGDGSDGGSEVGLADGLDGRHHARRFEITTNTDDAPGREREAAAGDIARGNEAVRRFGVEALDHARVGEDGRRVLAGG